MIGKILGHYRVVEKIGEGGMGVVYRAYDEHLHREVAIKILPQGALNNESSRRRFRREALTLAKLNHPNIETVYEFASHDGIDFLVLEYVSGAILADKIRGGALAEREVAQIGVQLAAALEEAHDRGIVHRDLKPRNMAVTSKGQVKVLDFGLAKIMRPENEVSTTDVLTGTAAIAGTLPYMAPEQLRGEQSDARSDIYAAGMVLYEMATGKHPFSGKAGSALIDAILYTPPPAPARLRYDISLLLEAIIVKCLEKAPENRYQSAKELLVDLRRLAMSTGVTSSSATGSPRRLWSRLPVASYSVIGALILVIAVLALNVDGWRIRPFPRSTLPPIRSLAVLPLANLSADPQQAYFADGMTEELINNLSKISALRVISHSSVMQYQGTRRPLSEVARELHVDAVVEGAVQRFDSNVKISASLVDTRVDRNLWGRSYEGNLSHVLRLQSAVAQAIATEVRVQLTPQESANLAQNRTVDTQAFEAYLRGRYFWNKRTPEDLRRSVDEFKKAIDLDPTYALAWAGLADGYSMLSDYDEQRPQDAMPKARAAAKKALELDNSLGEPWATIANVEWAYDWNTPAAEKDFHNAITLSPNYATAHQWYGMYLCNGARFDEGIAELERARTLDPLSLVIEVNIGRCRYYARDYDRAVEILEALDQREPDYWIVHAILGQTYLSKGQVADSIRELERARTLSPDSLRNWGVLGDAYARAGRRDDALAAIRKLAVLSRKRYIPPIYNAMVYVGLGDRSQAMVFLEKAFNDRSNWMVLLKSEPEFDSLRADERFRDLLGRIVPSTEQSEEPLQTLNVLGRDADAKHIKNVSLLDRTRRRD